MHKIFTTLVATLLLSSLAGAAQAGGKFIPGYGSQAQPRAGAFAAKADDPSAIFHNPAGLAKLKGTMVHIGVNFINFSQEFTRAGTYDQCTDAKCPNGVPYAGESYETVENQAHGKVHVGDFAVVPLISATSDLGLDLPIVFAVGVFAPAAASVDREFSPDYVIEGDPNTPPPPQRYDIIRQEITALMPSLAVGYHVNDKIDLGARVTWGFADVKGEVATWGLRNYEEWEGFDADFAIEGRDKFIPSFGLGGLYRPHPSVELGVNYRSAQHIRAEGIGIATAGTGTLIEGLDVLQPKTDPPYVCGADGTIVAFKACVETTVPQVASIAGRWILRDANGGERADVEIDLQWEDWSAGVDVTNLVDAKTITLNKLPPSIIRHGFKDVLSARLGGSYTIPVGVNKLSVRGGLAYDTEAAPVSWTRLDADGFARTTIATGVGFEIPGWRFELSGGAVLEGTRTVDHGGCNPTTMDIGCSGNTEVAVSDRDAPDPAQPIYGVKNQSQSPFNAGVYKQGYVFLGTGVTAWF
jgi:long-chain fatty acid transport protein